MNLCLSDAVGLYCSEQYPVKSGSQRNGRQRMFILIMASPWLDDPVGCGRDVLVALLSQETIRRVISGT